MAKEWAKPFYNSTAWKKLRMSYIAKVYGLCEWCGEPGYIVDHIKELTPRKTTWVQKGDPMVQIKKRALRPDRQGPHRRQFEKNKQIILKTQRICGICGKPVDMHLKYPDPMSPVIDHIIPIDKGGHPSAMENLQLAHWSCNRQKSDKLFASKGKLQPQNIGNRDLAWSTDWTSYTPRKL